MSLVFLLLRRAQRIAALLHTLPLKPCCTTFSHPHAATVQISHRKSLKGGKPPATAEPRQRAAPKNTLIQRSKSSSSCKIQNGAPAFQKAKLINRREPRGTKLSQAVFASGCPARPFHPVAKPQTTQQTQSGKPSHLTIRPSSAFSHSSFPQHKASTAAAPKALTPASHKLRCCTSEVGAEQPNLRCGTLPFSLGTALFLTSQSSHGPGEGAALVSTSSPQLTRPHRCHMWDLPQAGSCSPGTLLRSHPCRLTDH